MSNTATAARYREVETLRDEEGVVCVITERKSTGYLSFRIQKEYEFEGETRVTGHLGERHIPAVERLLDQLKIRLLDLTQQRKTRRTNKGYSHP